MIRMSEKYIDFIKKYSLGVRFLIAVILLYAISEVIQDIVEHFFAEVVGIPLLNKIIPEIVVILILAWLPYRLGKRIQWITDKINGDSD